MLFCASSTSAQCPPNIDFELGTFGNWQCYTGTLDPATSIMSEDPSPPVANRHTMLSAVPGNGLDYYGGFPQNCPNGSAHSIRLGNNKPGAEAERIAYTFSIPPTQTSFSLIYHYAVVLQDFGHAASQQPRLSIEVKDLTDNTLIPCSSFDFVANGNMPGFFDSPHGTVASPVRCKDWAAASINLDGYAGKTIELSFTTRDCSQGEHFGYAYIDINSECSSSFVGATFCPDDTAINIIAPNGYQKYVWFNNTYTQILGNQQTLHLSPPPASGGSIAVELTPYNGYGCKDTLIANLFDTLTIQAYAGADTTVCQNAKVQLGTAPKIGHVYKWSPVAGLSDPNIANPVATVTGPVTYQLTETHDGGGCKSIATVKVGIVDIDTSLTVLGLTSFCRASGQITTLKVNPEDSIQWYKDNIAIAGATDTILQIDKSGSYRATLFTAGGCSANTRDQQIDIYESPVPDFSVKPICVNLPLQLKNLTTSSSVSTTQYLWDFGNGQTSTAAIPVYSYPLPGNYTIKLSVSSLECPLPLVDTQKTVTIDQPATGIKYPVKDAVINFPEPLTARTFGVSYLWKPATSLDNPIIYNPNFKGASQQNYLIEIKTATGCITVDTQMVKTHKKIAIYVPTVFTAGTANNNGYLKPLLMGFQKVNFFRIYNRWGKLLFEMHSDLPGWNGKTGGTSEEIQSVVWMIEAVDVDGITHFQQGTTVLIR